MRQVRPSRSWWGIVALAGLWACETARNPGNVQFDQIPPVIKLTTSADTQQIGSGLSFSVAASDDRVLREIRLTFSGNNIPVQVEARQLGGIATVGFIIVPRNAVVDPTTPPTDSLVFTPPARQPPDTIYSDTLTVQNGFTSFTVTGFAVDAGGRRALTPPVTVTVQTPGNDLTPPTVSHTISSRVEANDHVTVHATDPSGISWIGFRVDPALGAAPPFVGT